MIDLYYGPTSNGRKITIMLEETGLPYVIHPIDIVKGDQFTPEFLAISPNNKMPAIIDRDGPGGQPLQLFESGAILLYLARKTNRFLPPDPVQEAHCLQWLMWQMGGIGPMFGQWVHFSMYAPAKIPYAIERYRLEVDRLRLVADRHLAANEYFAGDYSIADMAVFAWAYGFRTRLPPAVPLPHFDAWIDRVAARPATMKGYTIQIETANPVAIGQTPVTDVARDVLFGAKQHGERFAP